MEGIVYDRKRVKTRDLNYFKIGYFVLLLFLIALIIILSGANKDNADLESSSWEFDLSTGIRQGEWLNWFFILFCRRLGLTFEVYHFLIYLIGYLLLFCTLYRYTDITIAGLVSYAIFPFTIDFIQTPNFASMALSIFAIGFLTLKNKKVGKLLFLFFLICAGGFHVIAYLFLPLFFLKFNKSPDAILKKGMILGVITFTITVIDKATNLTSLILKLFSFDERASIYLESTTSFGFLLYWFVQIILFGLIWYACKHLNNSDNRSSLFAKIVLYIVCYSFVFMPIVSKSGLLFRIVRNYIVLVYFCWFSYVKRAKNTFLPKLLLLSIPLCLSAIMLLTMNDSVTWNNISNLFSENWILGA